jgi:murein DD-endopeptidase MepM/ murein hydrolase activator NlpD
MGDPRAGSTGTTATTVPAPALRSAAPGPAIGKRVARHAAEQRSPTPYAGRRVAQVLPVPLEVATDAHELPYAGRRAAGAGPLAAPAAAERILPGRRIALIPELPGDPEDVAGHLLRAAAAPGLETYVGRRMLQPVLAEPVLAEPVRAEPVLAESVLAESTVADAADLVDPVLAVHPELGVDIPSAPPATRRAPTQRRPGGRRVASRRSRIPSLPLLAGVAVLAVSAGGALQAVHPALDGGAADDHLSPASTLSGSSAVGSASVLGGRGTAVSRDANRSAASSTNGESLQAAADQQAKQRDAALSAFAAQAEKQASKIKLHQWVLPVASGDYHLTARFGDYSSLWSHFHTGLDFAGPTGTPILAVAGGTVTEISYSGAYGNRTIETLPDGTELWYCHQNEFGTSVGATLKPGQLMGYIGSTGNVTGPHLHLEVHPGGGDPVDPYTALIVHGLQP